MSKSSVVSDGSKKKKTPAATPSHVLITPLKRRCPKSGRTPCGFNTVGRSFSQNLFNEFKDKLNTGGIYVLQPPNAELNLFKVGYAQKLAHRLDTYCTYYPTGFRVFMILHGLNVSQARSGEKTVHRLLEEQSSFRELPTCGKRQKKTEWFQLDPNANKTVRQLFALIRNALKTIEQKHKPNAQLVDFTKFRNSPNKV